MTLMTQPTVQYLTWLNRKRQASRSTLDKYRHVLTAWEAWCDQAGLSLIEADADTVEAFASRPRSRGVTTPSPATVALDVAVLGSFYRWAQARLGYEHNPSVLAARPKVHNRIPRPVDDDTWLDVWSAPLSDDARVALGLGYYCGLRRAEMMGLRGSQVWGRAIVSFTRKGGGDDRFDYADVLDHWEHHWPHMEAHRLDKPLRTMARARGEERLFAWPATDPGALNRRFGGWLTSADVAADAFTPHQLRHSFATNLFRTGVPLPLITTLCNHTSPDITMRYIKASGGMLASLRKDTYATRATASEQ